MILAQFDELLILTLSIWFLALGSLFGMIWQTSRTTMMGRQRTRLSHAHHALAGGMVIMSFGVGIRSLFRWIKGPADDAVFEPLPVGIVVQTILVIGLVITTWAGGRVFAALLERTRGANTGIGISQERILATVAMDLPMVVSDQEGVIRYATEPMEELAGATSGELDGLNLTEIMPERYESAHRSGLDNYLRTGDSKILGKVINVDLLRRDGSEIPISLALTKSEADEQQFFIGLMWQRDAWDLPGMNVRQDERGVTQDQRETDQNTEDHNLEIRRSQQDQREARQNKRDDETTDRVK